MPPKRKSVVPKRTAADVEAEYAPQLEKLLTHRQHLQHEISRLESLDGALGVDLGIARDRSNKDAGRLAALREVHIEKKAADIAAQKAANAVCDDLSRSAFIKRRRVQDLQEERRQLQQQLEAIRVKEAGDNWELSDVYAAQDEVARLVAEVSEAQRRAQRFGRAVDVARELGGTNEDPSSYFPVAANLTASDANTATSSSCPPLLSSSSPLHLAVLSSPTNTNTTKMGPRCPVQKLINTFEETCGFIRRDVGNCGDLLKRLRSVLACTKSNCALVVVVHAFMRKSSKDGLWEVTDGHPPSSNSTNQPQLIWVSLDRLILAAMSEGDCPQVTLIVEGMVPPPSSATSSSAAAPIGCLLSRQAFLSGQRDHTLVVEYQRHSNILESALRSFVQGDGDDGGDGVQGGVVDVGYHGAILAQVVSHILCHSASNLVAANESSLPALAVQSLRLVCGGGRGLPRVAKVVSPADHPLCCPPLLTLPTHVLRRFLLSGIICSSNDKEEHQAQQHPLLDGLFRLLSNTTVCVLPPASQPVTPIPWSWSIGVDDAAVRRAPQPTSVRLRHALVPAYTNSLATSRIQCLLAEREELWEHVADRIRAAGGPPHQSSHGGHIPSVTVRPRQQRGADGLKEGGGQVSFTGRFLEGPLLSVLIAPLSVFTGPQPTSSEHPVVLSSSTALEHMTSMLSIHLNGDEASHNTINGVESPSATRKRRRLQGLVAELQHRVRDGVELEPCALHTESLTTVVEGIYMTLEPFFAPVPTASIGGDDEDPSVSNWAELDATTCDMQTIMTEVVKVTRVVGTTATRAMPATTHDLDTPPVDGICIRIDVSSLNVTERAHLAATLHHHALVDLQAGPPLFLASDVSLTTTTAASSSTSSSPLPALLSVLEDALPSLLPFVV